MQNKKQEELQKKAIEFQMIEQELRQIEKQIILLHQQLLEFRNLEENIEELKNIKPETEMLSQIGAGIFIKSKIEDSNNLLMNIGANTAVLKTREEAMEIVKKQIEQINSILLRMQEEFQRLAIHAQSIQEEFQTSE